MIKFFKSNTVLYTDIKILFRHDINGILVGLDFFNNFRDIFFDKYLTKEVCKNEFEKGKYGYIRCYSSNFTQKDMKSFPNIYLKNKELNYIFELSYKDLFFKDDEGEIYFLIICDMLNKENNNFIIGKPFLKKYTFTVDNDSGQISFFVKKENQDNKNKYLIIIILSIICFLLLVLSMFFGYKFIARTSKKKEPMN